VLEHAPIRMVEAFHLTFLRVFEARYDRAKYVVKGGVNVRAWFGSDRYSEDIDIDAIGGAPHMLEAAMDKLLAGRDLQLLLTRQGLEITKIAKPKMTETTQRWRFELKSGQTDARTKIEFSWREDGGEPYVLEPVLRDIADAYGMLPPTANHYTAAAAVRQKIRALAMRRETQARDIWDLEHLFRQPSADPRPLPAALVELVRIGQDRVWAVDYAAYASQVLSYLAPQVQELHRTPDVWDRIRTAVLERLEELLG
jgi:predicted nucleotidyltransferase component of viral defense system